MIGDPVADFVAQARAARDPQRLVSFVPYARFLNLSLYLEDGDLRTRLAYDPKIIGNPVLPALHGGVVGAVLESTGIFRLVWDVPSARLPKIINITVTYLRSARPEDVFARAAVTKHGRRVASVRLEAWQSERDKLIATADANFLLKPMDGESS